MRGEQSTYERTIHMRKTSLIPMEQLALLLSTTENELREMTRNERLPFSHTTMFGLVIHQRDLPQWRHAVDRER
jgi:hypothetical protein